MIVDSSIFSSQVLKKKKIYTFDSLDTLPFLACVIYTYVPNPQHCGYTNGISYFTRQKFRFTKRYQWLIPVWCERISRDRNGALGICMPYVDIPWSVYILYSNVYPGVLARGTPERPGKPLVASPKRAWRRIILLVPLDGSRVTGFG